MSRVDTALIMASGHGSRFFPVTKSVNKAMLPLGNRPVVDYLVDQLIEAGVRHIVFHVSRLDDTLVHYYSNQPAMIEQLEQQGVAEDRLARISNLHLKAEFSFVTMQDKERYGTSLPLHEITQSVNVPDQFLLLNSDAVFVGENPFTKIVDIEGAGILAKEVDVAEVSNYGILSMHDNKLIEIIEKPSPGQLPSKFANLGLYRLTRDVLGKIEAQLKQSVIGEYKITDVISELAVTHPIQILETDCEWLDCGTPEGLYRAWQSLSK